MPQLFSQVIANRVGVIPTNDIHEVVTPANPPQDVFVNTDSPIGIVKVFSRIHLHEDLLPPLNSLRGVHQIDVVVLRASDQTLLGGTSLDFGNPPGAIANNSALQVFSYRSSEKDFDWGAEAASGIIVTKTGTNQAFSMPTPSYFLVQPGDAVVVQLWVFSNFIPQFSIGWFSAIAYVKVKPDGTLV